MSDEVILSIDIQTKIIKSYTNNGFDESFMQTFQNYISNNEMISNFQNKDIILLCSQTTRKQYCLVNRTKTQINFVPINIEIDKIDEFLIFQSNVFEFEKEIALHAFQRKIFHDISNPLTAIMMNLDYLNESINDFQLDEGILDILTDVIEGSIKATDKIKNLIEHRIDPVISNQFPSLPVSQLIYQVLSIIYSKINTDVIFLIKVDQKAIIHQLAGFIILKELLSNAITAANRDFGLITIYAQENPNLHIKIKDFGIGLQGNSFSQLLKPLFSTTGKLGIGLSFVEYWVKYMNAKFDLYESNKTTIASVLLPDYNPDV